MPRNSHKQIRKWLHAIEDLIIAVEEQCDTPGLREDYLNQLQTAEQVLQILLEEGTETPQTWCQGWVAELGLVEKIERPLQVWK